MKVPIYILVLIGVIFCLSSAQNADDILEVFVVPHSHCDPGWWNTARGYYNDWTRGIITSVVTALLEDEKQTFIWAEISFFQMWWDEQSEERKKEVVKLAQSGRLEFVTGGWTMPDEAATHMTDILHSFTEGHNWLQHNLQVKPKYGWAIDPFGHSSVMPYLASQMGLDGIVINRVHQDTKTMFRDRKQLEFIWRQNFEVKEEKGKFDTLTHMLAYPLYDIPNTCGPDWNTCAQFDFERPESIKINNENIKQRATILIDQYKKKASNFRHKNLLIPLGDDFKYKNIDITRHIFHSYKLLFEHINSNVNEYRVNIRFATLTQYFEAVLQSQNKNSDNSKTFPIYHGDFFTYMDRSNEYWSGYFTTRPFVKALSRRTETAIKTTETMYALAKLHSNKNTNFDWLKAHKTIEESRQGVGLYQHHDGITGTSRAHVVNDYASILNNALWSVKELTTQLVHLLLTSSIPTSQSTLKLSHNKCDSKEIPKLVTINFDSNNNNVVHIIVTNSLIDPRAQLIEVTLPYYKVTIKGPDGKIIPYDVLPVWKNQDTIATDEYIIVFAVSLPGFAIYSYTLEKTDSIDVSVSKITILSNKYTTTTTQTGPFTVTLNSINNQVIELENEELKININNDGLLESVSFKTINNKIMEMKQTIETYGSRRSGAYLFNADGPSTLYQSSDPTIILIKCNLLQRSFVHYGHTITNQITLTTPTLWINKKPNINVVLTSNIADYSFTNKELITRFKTTINNNGIMYTDSNGLDLQYRKHNPNYPIGGNYYPITSTVSITDDNTKFSVLTRHPLGVASLSNGQLDLVLDRKLSQDDGRGMGEGVTDNVYTEYHFILTFEHFPFETPNQIVSDWVFKSWKYHNYPLEYFHSTNNPNLSPNFSPMTFENKLPSYIDILTFTSHSGSSDDYTFILRVQNRSPTKSSTIDLTSMFPNYRILDFKPMTLTLLNDKKSTIGSPYLHNNDEKLYRIQEGVSVYEQRDVITTTSTIPSLFLHPMEIGTYLLSLSVKTEQQQIPITPQPSPTVVSPSPSIVSPPSPDVSIPVPVDQIINQEVNTKAPVPEIPLSNGYYLFVPSATLLSIACFFVMRRRTRRRLLKYFFK